MDRKLFWNAMVKFFSGLLAVGLLVFLPAGTFAFRQGWLLMGVLFVPMFLAGLVMMAKNPELLRRRLNAKEEQGEQRQVIAASGLMFLASFVLAGLNFRFGWLPLPKCCGRTATSPGPSRCRRGSRWWTRGCTAWCATPCTPRRCCCFSPCR